jgi:hypothetical protein
MTKMCNFDQANRKKVIRTCALSFKTTKTLILRGSQLTQISNNISCSHSISIGMLHNESYFSSSVSDLWLGAVSDSGYQEKSGVLEFQHQFQESDKSSKLRFTNIVAAWRTGAGLQLLLQPFFARSQVTTT